MLRTHFASSTSAATPAMSGAEALVPVKESMQSPSIVVEHWARGKNRAMRAGSQHVNVNSHYYMHAAKRETLLAILVGNT